MYTGVRLTLPKAGAFGENTVSKNEGSLGEKPNLGKTVTFDLPVSVLIAEIAKESSKRAKMISRIGGVFG